MGNISAEGYLFLVFICAGILIGVFFDIFRVIRRTFKSADIITYIEDIIFWLLTGFLILYTIFYFNNGEIRTFMFLGLILGTIVYLLVFSKTFIKVNVFVINKIKKFIGKVIHIILFPFKLIFNPIKFVIIKINGNITNSIKKSLKILSKHTIIKKKLIKKKDFKT